MKVYLEKIKPRNLIAKDLRSPKYRMRVVSSKKIYNRQQEEQKHRKEIYAT
jgi:hypothetical protein